MVLMAAAVGVVVAMITGTMVVRSVVAAVAMVVVVMVVVMVVAVMIEEVAVALVDVVVSSGMILCLQKARFSCFLKKRNGHTDGRTYYLCQKSSYTWGQSSFIHQKITNSSMNDF